MVDVARVGDQSAGHPGHGPLTIITGTSKVTVSGVQVAIVGSKTTPGHDSPQTIVEGNSKVKINGIQIATVGSKLSCNDVVATGTSKFTIGG